LPSVLDIIVNHMGCSGEAVKWIAVAALVPAAAVSLQNARTPDSGFFEDVTNASGLQFVHHASPTSCKYLVESMTGGVAVLDYNNTACSTFSW